MEDELTDLKDIIDTNYPVYYSIALRDFRWLEKFFNPNTPKAELQGGIEEIEQNVIVVVIFSAFTVESFINQYAFEKLPGDYEEYLKGISFVRKWVVIPKLVNGKDTDLGSKVIKNLERLAKLRNFHAHYKPVNLSKIPKEKFRSVIIKRLPWFDKAQFAIETVRESIRGLHEIDASIDTSWLNC